MNLLIYIAISLALLAVQSSAGTLPVESKVEQKRLVRTSETEDPKWLTQDQILGLIRNGITFMDVTDRHTKLDTQRKSRRTFDLPEEVQYREHVENAISKLNVARIEDFLFNFTSFHNRYYDLPNGAEASNFLFGQIVDAYLKSGYSGGVDFTHHQHTWLQKSVIVSIPGLDDTVGDEVVILGAHMDSLNLNGITERAPGADDNGASCAVLLEVFTALLESGFRPKRTVEFQWYAAEEVGLRGSGEIAEWYSDVDVKVVSMLNYDIIGYQGGDQTIAFGADLTNPPLTQFLRTVLNSYLEYPSIDRTCGYACSDFYPWHEAGYAAAYAKQAVTNPYMHSTQDSYDIVNFDQVMEFGKLAIGYIVEVAEPFVEIK